MRTSFASELTLNDIPRICRLSLDAADTPPGIFVMKGGAAAKAYDELIAYGFVEELEEIHPSIRVFRTTEDGKALYSRDKLTPVPTNHFSNQPAYAL